MKKIAIVLGRLGTHGPSLIRIELAKELLRRGFSVDFVIGGDPLRMADQIPQDCNVRILGSLRVRNFIIELGKYLKAERPDGVLASSWPYSAAAILAVKLFAPDASIAVSEHADFRTNIRESGEFTSRDVWIIRTLSKYIYGMAHKVVGVSQGVIDGLVEVAGITREKTAVIYNPLRSLPLSANPEHLVELDGFWSHDVVKLLAVGRLATAKDYPTLLRAMTILKDRGEFRLLVIGEGSLRPELERIIEENNLSGSVRLGGQSEWPADYFRRADLFVLSSSSEGFGNVIIEALSFGLPVVSTDCRSGPAEILCGGTYGVLTPVGDPSAFAHGVQRALNLKFDPGAQKERAERFSVAKATEQYLSALNLPARANS